MVAWMLLGVTGLVCGRVPSLSVEPTTWPPFTPPPPIRQNIASPQWSRTLPPGVPAVLVAQPRVLLVKGESFPRRRAADELEGLARKLVHRPGFGQAVEVLAGAVEVTHQGAAVPQFFQGQPFRQVDVL